MNRGCKVKILTGAGPWNNVPADVFYGAVNLDKAAQAANVSFYGAASVYDAASQFAAANALGVNGATATMQLSAGVHLDERRMSITTDAAISGAGIAVYYDVTVH